MNPQTLEHSLDAGHSELGKKSVYESSYNPEKLFVLPRSSKRHELGIDSQVLPFYGFDYWNHYEVSWLNEKGKPTAAMAQIVYDCSTPNIVESKSLKLYFNSLNQSQFKDCKAVELRVQKDLTEKIGGAVQVTIYELQNIKDEMIYHGMSGTCLDNLDVECHEYNPDPLLLTTVPEEIEETVYSNLLKSNCLVTNQPDWGTVEIQYRGNKIQHENLLKYIVSFRQHNEFHEQCIERIFIDILQQCNPKELTVYGRYTRRGGLDINPYRSTRPSDSSGKNRRLIRQ